MRTKTFRPCDQHSLLLMPPSLHDWVDPAGLPAFVSDLVDELDLAPFLAAHDEPRGMPPYHPAMMLKVLLYGYATGVRSSCSLGASKSGSCLSSLSCGRNHLLRERRHTPHAPFGVPGWTRPLRPAIAFPEGAFELLSLELMVASQRVLGCLGFLEVHGPSVILTDYDRHHFWSCLVLAARKLGIPSVTLVHGVIERDAFGFSPVLADHILCCGELDRAKLLDAGEASSRVTVAGCPRLSRDLPSPSPEGRRRLGVDHDGPVAMLATDPESIRFELAEAFCRAIERLPGMSGVVRLHPSEDLASYQTMIARHPTVSFVENRRASVDEALAEADIVVVRASGFGSDALVKRKPVVVLSPTRSRRVTIWILIELAGCPHAHNSGELARLLAG